MALIKGKYNTYVKTQLAMNLIGALRVIRNDPKYANLKKATECKELSDAINVVLKANYKVTIDPTIFDNAYVYPPTVDKNSPLWRNDLKEWFPDHLDEDARKLAKKSTRPMLDLFIDAETGEYKGELAKIEIPIYISWNLAVGNKVKEEGVAGIIAHEVGHANWMFRSISWTMRSAVILNQLHSIMGSNKPRDTKVEVLTLINKREKLPLADKVEWIVDANDVNTAAVITMGALQHQQRDELGGAGFEARNFEALADQYATEQGLGNDLIVALSQLPGSGTWVKGSAARIASQTATAVIWATMTVLSGGIAALIPVLLIASHDPENKIYDDPADRSARIIRQQIASMAQRRGEVSKEELERLKAAQRISEAYANSPMWVEYLNEILTPGGRHSKAQRELQQALEILAANPLVVKAAELENI